MNELNEPIVFFRGFLDLIKKNDQSENLTIEIIKSVVSCQHPFTLPLKNEYNLTEEERNYISKELQTQFSTTQNFGNTIIGEDKAFEPWWDKRKSSDSCPEMYFSDRFFRYMKQNADIPSIVLSRLDISTNEILDLTGDPLKDNFRRRGMVIGHVQSGKTSNYSGLICKAADAGYKIIILLAGITNSLRSQTQDRINHAFIGKSSSSSNKISQKPIGVGLITNNNAKSPVCFTSLTSDFLRANAQAVGTITLSHLNQPLIFVCKKNVKTLENINEYLEDEMTTNKIKEPLLLIDDEADNASINTKYNKGKITAINNGIRDILKKFDKSSYIGYTATPFANIFIDSNETNDLLKDDLFPKDYIHALEAPDNYVGPDRVFGNPPDGDLRNIMLRTVDDYEDLLPFNHKNGHQLEELPETLKQAVRSFILIKTIRSYRGNKNVHSTMMVNVSRFNSVQEDVCGLIYDYIDELKSDIKLNIKLEKPSANSAVHILEKQYNDEFINVISNKNNEENIDAETIDLEKAHINNKSERIVPTWTYIRNHLFQSIQLEVKTVNMKGGSLDYNNNDPKTLIAVGGLALSRGLTLEGLCVSYILRNASAYDTLMQMGRWFGYRNNYEDLCRLYLPISSRDYYRDVTEAISELREEIKTMRLNKLTPSDFGLKVRENPKAIRITALNKMRSAKKITVELGMKGKAVEAHTLIPDEKTNNHNILTAKIFFDNLGLPLKQHNYFCFNQWTQQHLIWDNVNVDKIIKFFREIKVAEKSKEFYVDNGESLIIEFITQMKSYLSSWIVIINNEYEKTNVFNEKQIIPGINFKPRDRHQGVFDPHDGTYMITENRRLASPNGVSLSYKRDEYKRLFDDFKSSHEKDKQTPGKFYQFLTENIKLPILIFYIINPKVKKNVTNKNFKDINIKQMLSFMVHFPQDARLSEAKKTYYENTVNQKMKQMEFLYNVSHDEADEDTNDVIGMEA